MNMNIIKMNKYLAIMGYQSNLDGSFTSYHTEAEDPRLSIFDWEMEITNGLGFNKIKHHSDSYKGLIQHLGEMEMRVKDNHFKYAYKYWSETFGALTNMDYRVKDLQNTFETFISESNEFTHKAVQKIENIKHKVILERREHNQLMHSLAKFVKKPETKETAPKKKKGFLEKVLDFSGLH